MPALKLPMHERTPDCANSSVRYASNSPSRAISSGLPGVGSLYDSHASMFARRRGSVAIGSSWSANACASAFGSVMLGQVDLGHVHAADDERLRRYRLHLRHEVRVVFERLDQRHVAGAQQVEDAAVVAGDEEPQLGSGAGREGRCGGRWRGSRGRGVGGQRRVGRGRRGRGTSRSRGGGKRAQRIGGGRQWGRAGGRRAGGRARPRRPGGRRRRAGRAGAAGRGDGERCRRQPARCRNARRLRRRAADIFGLD